MSPQRPLIPRRAALDRLVHHIWNDRIKIITGIRRCGKTVLLFEEFRERLRQEGVDDDHVIEIRLDQEGSASLRDPSALYERIRSHVGEDRYYVLIDEIQEAISADEFRDIRFAHPRIYGVMNGLLAMGNLDIYVTGSNSRFLSTDIMTEFADRGTEIRLHPFSFGEYREATSGETRRALERYLLYGGMPQAVLEPDDEERRVYLQSLFATTYRQDIIRRYGIQRGAEMDSLVGYVASNIGNLTNPRNITQALRAAGSSISDHTVIDYLSHLSESFVVDGVVQAELRGKEMLQPKRKYYFEDLGLRNAVLGFPVLERGRLLENAVYNELVRRGFHVNVGRITVRRMEGGQRRNVRLECDFRANGTRDALFVQVAWSIDEQHQLERETRALEEIPDHHRKIIIVGNREGIAPLPSGIVVVGAEDFLSGTLGATLGMRAS